LLVGEERRRSQRVIIRVPVTLLVKEGSQTLRISARTVEVNIHGALVTAPRSFDADSELEMENGRTNETIGCRVTRAPDRAGFPRSCVHARFTTYSSPIQRLPARKSRLFRSNCY
jgi:hypothetical protein